MNYTHFNKFIYDYCFNSNNSGDEIIMSVDESVINQFQKEYKITNVELQESFKYNFHRNWEYALELNSEIPNFFGLIAIQIYIASQMKDENEELTHRTYNPRLIEYLGIKKEHLNKIYTNYQDNIWQGLKTWSNQNNYQITIPEIGFGTGRFIAYPLSHSLLNKEDLKYVPLIFEDVSLRPNESIAFVDFMNLITESINIQNQTNHFKRLKSRLEKDNKIERLYNQIHLFYTNEWAGELPIIKDKQQKTNELNNKTLNNKNDGFLYFNFDDKLIQKLSDDRDLLESISLLDLDLFIKTKSFFPFNSKNLLFFEKGNYEEWLYTKYLSCNTHIIICEKHNSYFIDRLGNLLNDFSNKLYTIKEIEITNNDSKYFTKALNLYSIENGLKIKRNQWLKNAGPDIVLSNNAELRINGIIHSENKISMLNYEVGVYKLRGSNIKPTEIEIIDSNPMNLLPTIADVGWQIDKDSNKWQRIESELNINGLCFSFKVDSVIENTQTWINAVSKKTNTQKYKTQIINALNRNRYGI